MYYFSTPVSRLSLLLKAIEKVILYYFTRATYVDFIPFVIYTTACEFRAHPIGFRGGILVDLEIYLEFSVLLLCEWLAVEKCRFLGCGVAKLVCEMDRPCFWNTDYL